MKSSILTLGLIGLVAAQSESDLPTCAQNCVTKFTTGSEIGGCSSLDAKCICANKDFLSNIACCLADVCSAADQQAAVNFAISFCKTQGVTVPTAVTCSSTLTGSKTSTSASGTSASSNSGTITSASGSGTGTAVGATTSGTESTTGSAAGSGATSSAASAASSATTASSNVGAGTGSGVTGMLGGILAALAFL